MKNHRYKDTTQLKGERGKEDQSNNYDISEAVSYTHLDVYKRQV